MLPTKGSDVPVTFDEGDNLVGGGQDEDLSSPAPASSSSAQLAIQPELAEELPVPGPVGAGVDEVSDNLGGVGRVGVGIRHRQHGDENTIHEYLKEQGKEKEYKRIHRDHRGCLILTVRCKIN